MTYDRKFIILVSPVSVQHGTRKGKFGNFYNDPKKKAYLDRIVSESSPYAPEEPIPLGVPIYLEANFYILDTTKQKRKGCHTLKPDRGNCLKSLEDGLESAGFFEDDKQICSGPVNKFWCEQDMPPRIEVHIKTIDLKEAIDIKRKPVKKRSL